jgi:hypothetical protein
MIVEDKLLGENLSSGGVLREVGNYVWTVGEIPITGHLIMVENIQEMTENKFGVNWMNTCCAISIRVRLETFGRMRKDEEEH